MTKKEGITANLIALLPLDLLWMKVVLSTGS
jgi:hypothetical protein